MTPQFKSLVFLSALLSIAGCGSVREQFDFAKKAPDEFAVMTRAPLEMPPDFNTLPTPAPGAPRPQEPRASELARSAVLGTEARRAIAQDNNVSEGEAVLLQRTGAAQAAPGIRAQVDAETEELVEKELPGIDQLRKMVGNPVEEPATVVDPVAETERIRQNKAQGKPLNTGETAIKED